MYRNLFTNEAAADCGIFTPVSQVAFGYLAGGAAFVVACAATTGEEEWRYKGPSGVATAAMSTAYILASTGTVYGIGQDAGCRGSFMWTLGGAVAAPILGGIIGGIKEGNKDGIFAGSLYGFLLTPISATIAYHLTKDKNNPDKKEIIVPLMSMRF